MSTTSSNQSESTSEDSLLTQNKVSEDKLPKHIAVIMDENGRWAQRQSLPRIEGHRQGVKSVRAVIEESARLGIQSLTLYCLSSENFFKRPKLELNFLFRLLEQYVIEERSQIMGQNIRFQTIGRREGLTDSVLREVDKTASMSRENTGMRLNLAVNYGSREEIVDGIKSIAAKVKSGELDIEDISSDLVSDSLYTAGQPDPDLVIRTAGEMRISNYLLWQISYAEIWVTDRCWPEFREPDLHQAIIDFANRTRKYGGLKK